MKDIETTHRFKRVCFQRRAASRVTLSKPKAKRLQRQRRRLHQPSSNTDPWWLSTLANLRFVRASPSRFQAEWGPLGLCRYSHHLSVQAAQVGHLSRASRTLSSSQVADWASPA